MMNRHILQVDSSPRGASSISRQITAYITQQLSNNAGELIHRDLAKTDLPLVNETMINAYFTSADQRSADQEILLTPSNTLIQELKQANTLIIGAPIYNFSVPAALKAWIDLVCRVGETFHYTDNGPEGLLTIERAFIVTSAGGTPIGSPIDFNSAYLEHICHFIGIEEVHIIDASGSKRDPATLIDFAKAQVDKIISAT